MPGEPEDEYNRLENDTAPRSGGEPDPAVGAVGMGVDRPVAPEPAGPPGDLWIDDEPDGTTERGDWQERTTAGVPMANPGMLAGYGSLGPPAAPPVAAYDAVAEEEDLPTPAADLEPTHEQEPETAPAAGSGADNAAGQS